MTKSWAGALDLAMASKPPHREAVSRWSYVFTGGKPSTWQSLTISCSAKPHFVCTRGGASTEPLPLPSTGIFHLPWNWTYVSLSDFFTFGELVSAGPERLEQTKARKGHYCSRVDDVQLLKLFLGGRVSSSFEWLAFQMRHWHLFKLLFSQQFSVLKIIYSNKAFLLGI